jgi:hypothetical protein
MAVYNGTVGFCMAGSRTYIRVQFLALIHSSKCEWRPWSGGGRGEINTTFVVRKLNVVYLNWKHPDHFSIHHHRDNISTYTVMFTVVPTLHRKWQYGLTVYCMVDEIRFSITNVQTHTAPLLPPSWRVYWTKGSDR